MFSLFIYFCSSNFKHIHAYFPSDDLFSLIDLSSRILLLFLIFELIWIISILVVGFSIYSLSIWWCFTTRSQAPCYIVLSISLEQCLSLSVSNFADFRGSDFSSSDKMRPTICVTLLFETIFPCFNYSLTSLTTVIN